MAGGVLSQAPVPGDVTRLGGSLSVGQHCHVPPPGGSAAEDRRFVSYESGLGFDGVMLEIVVMEFVFFELEHLPQVAIVDPAVFNGHGTVAHLQADRTYWPNVRPTSPACPAQHMAAGVVGVL